MADGPFASPTFDRNACIKLAEPVGAASISPSARDLVLASTSGLRILDLDNPERTARFIRCQTSSSIADVQWSPHAFRDSWICSTAGNTALLWDVAHIKEASPLSEQLKGHSRSITDINFSAHHPEILATCSIDTFIHLWDVRIPAQPVIRFADWRESVSQVKFNRQDEHVLASSQGGRLDIWDDRKGAIPIRSIRAHATKIYGIDWHREYKDNILTCSLDKTIKLWNWTRADDDAPEDLVGQSVDRVIRTGYPVWRARYTPFGHGILSMPQRNDYRLHLYDSRTHRFSDRDASMDSVHLFRGHQTPVKEFLWRHRGSVSDNYDMRDFQLVSVSADHSVRLHHLTPAILSKIGYTKGAEFDSPLRFTRKDAVYRTFASEGEHSLSQSGIGPERSYVQLLVPNESHPRQDAQRKRPLAGSSLERPSHLRWRTEPSTLNDSLPSSLQDASFESRDTVSSILPSTLEARNDSLHEGKWPSMSQHSSQNTTSFNSFISELDAVAGVFEDSPTKARLNLIRPATEPLLAEEDELDDDFEGLDMFDEDDDDEDDALLGAFIRTSRPSKLAEADAQVNVPSVRTCSARWSASGTLICLFPAKQSTNNDRGSAKVPDFRGVASLLYPSSQGSTNTDGSSELSHGSLEGMTGARSGSIFQASGLQFDHPLSSWRTGQDPATNKDAGGEQPQENTSGAASTQDENSDGLANQAHSSFETAESLASYHNTEPLQQGWTMRLRHKRTSKSSLAVIAHDLSDLLPAKRSLAESYVLDGDPADVCGVNASVSMRHKLRSHARAWQEAALLLRQASGRSSGLRASAEAGQTGRDPKPRMPSRSCWRNGHPLGCQRLLKLLQQFESQADEQMLAMLAFVFEHYVAAGSGRRDESGESSSGASTDIGEEDEGTAMVRSRRARQDARSISNAVTMHWKNEARFRRRGGDASSTGKAIFAALAARFTGWRGHYADLLYSWGLYEARAQMLQADGMRAAAGDADLSVMLDAPQGFGSLSECGVCNAQIHGEAKFCGFGMHSLHERCYKLFEEHHDDSALEATCPLGCNA